MGMAVVTVASGGMPVVEVTATKPALGLSVTEAANGLGCAVTKVLSGGIAVTYSGVDGVIGGGAQRITNGDFALNPINAAQNTVQNGWQWNRFAGTSAVTWNGSLVTVAPDGVNRCNLISAPLTTIIGRSYRVEFDLNGTLNVQVGTGVGTADQGLSGTIYAANHSVGHSSFVFVANAASMRLAFGRLSAASVTVDNVSVYGPL